MAVFTRDKVHNIFAHFPQLLGFLSTSLRKQTTICPHPIVRGAINTTETGYWPQGANPRDFTNFEEILSGFDPVLVEWEHSVTLPFDGTLDQRYQQSNPIKVRGLGSKATSLEK